MVLLLHLGPPAAVVRDFYLGSSLTVEWAGVWQQGIESGREGPWAKRLGQETLLGATHCALPVAAVAACSGNRCGSIRTAARMTAAATASTRNSVSKPQFS